MNGIRKTIAVFFIVCVGIPVLLGIIWAVGVTRAVVSPRFLSEVPREIIDKLPVMMDEVVASSDYDTAYMDEDEREWLKAARAVKTSPKQLMEDIGLMNWLRSDFTASLDRVGKILRGETDAGPVILNMRPLKEALKHEKVKQYLTDILQQLPECTDSRVNRWEEALAHIDYNDHLPACKPIDLQKAVEVVSLHWNHDIDEIPDEVNLVKSRRGDLFDHRAINFAQLVVTLTFFLFLIPAVFLALFALVATSSGPSMLRWMGYPTIIAGGLSFLLAKFSYSLAQFGSHELSFGFDHVFNRGLWLDDVMVEKFSDMGFLVLDHIFESVGKVSGVVCIVGVILIAVSYLVFSERKKEEKIEDKNKSKSTGEGESGFKPSEAKPAGETQPGDKPQEETEMPALPPKAVVDQDNK